MLSVSFKSTFLAGKVWQPYCKQFVRRLPYETPFIHFLNNQPQTQLVRLENGLTVATQERNCCNATIAFYFDAGARYESALENGIAHLFEHIAFKGSKSLNKTVIEDQLSSAAARVKCITTRELVTYYAECLGPYVSLVLSTMYESIYNNEYSATEIEKQRQTVYLEMLEHETNYPELLDDYLHSTAFQGTPLSQTVMGQSCNLRAIDGAAISRYVTRMFSPTRTVLVGVGAVSHEQFVSLAHQTVGKVAPPALCPDDVVNRFTGSEVRFRDDSVPKANVALAFEGPSFRDKDNVVMEVAANLLGGWDSSQPAGENHACRLARAASAGQNAESYRAFNINYKDTGLWGIQFMGPSLYLEDMLYNVQDELMKLCTILCEGEMERARRETKTKLLTRCASATGACHEIGRWALFGGCCPSLVDRIADIDNVSAERLRDVCYSLLYDKCPAVAAVGPTEGLTEYNRIRASMYWLRL